MSDRDKELVKAIGLAPRELGPLIGVQPHAFAQGVSRQGHHYLVKGRLLSLFAGLVRQYPERASLLMDAIKGAFTSKEVDDLYANGLGSLTLQSSPMKIEGTTFKEIWIFASHPFEIDEGPELNEIVRDHYTDPEKHIVYFIAPGYEAGILRGIVIRELKKLQSSRPADEPIETAKIEIVESSAIGLCPHFVIINPTNEEEARGYLVLKGQVIPIDAKQLETTLKCLRFNGVGLSKDSLAADLEGIEAGGPRSGHIDFSLIFTTDNART